MKFIYLDTGLVSELGHHANFCRGVVQELRARRQSVEVFGHERISKALQVELGARPFFRRYTYQNTPHKSDRFWDPLCGWLTSFDIAWRATKEDLDQITDVSEEDLIYVNSAMAPQLHATLTWLRQMPQENRPGVIMELNLDPGVHLAEESAEELWKAPDPRIDSRATLYRYVSKDLEVDDRRNLKLMTFDPSTSEAYQRLMNYPVEAWPVPLRAVTSGQSRKGKALKTISILGQQRPEKGYSLVPELASMLLQARHDIVLLVHNASPGDMPHEQAKLRELAKREPRLVLNELVAGPELWRNLLEASDLIICPYNPVLFKTRCSGVTNEALANSIPVVVPANTSLSKTLAEFGAPGTTFDSYRADSVFEATVSLLNNFDHYARMANRACKGWEQTCGSGRIVDKLLSWQEVRADSNYRREQVPALV